MTNIFTFLAQAAETASASTNPFQAFLDSGLGLMLGFFLMFYFLLIRPQQTQRKEHERRISELKKGDKVITSGGLHGVINHKGETTVSLKVADGMFITVETANITVVKSTKAS